MIFVTKKYYSITFCAPNFQEDAFPRKRIKVRAFQDPRDVMQRPSATQRGKVQKIV